MPKAKRPGAAKDHDFATIARNVVEYAMGEKLEGSRCPIRTPARTRLLLRSGSSEGQGWQGSGEGPDA
jgi:hypothetical protein